MNLEQLRTELNATYERLRSHPSIQGGSAEFVDQLSAPLLIQPTQRWLDGEHRVLVVGQETREWGPNLVNTFAAFSSHADAVDQVLETYREFSFGATLPSAFWSHFKDLRQAFDSGNAGFESSVLWTNLYRVSVEVATGKDKYNYSAERNSTPTQRTALRDLSRTVLLEEIRLLEPTMVVFFTGPNYDAALKDVFQGAVLSAVEPFTARQMSWVQHPALPTQSIRSYHPGYMNRAKPPFFDRLLEVLAAKP
jgi:hypothetical protein